MNIYEVIDTRLSVRKYKPDEVPDEVLNRGMNALRKAPSAGNNQPWRLIVVEDQSMRKKLSEATVGQEFIGNAPVIIVACGWKDKAYSKMGGYWNSLPVDVTIALDHLTLAAAAEGLGTCWIGDFKENEVKKLLGIPGDVMIISLMSLGFPLVPSKPRPRKDLSEIVCREQWI